MSSASSVAEERDALQEQNRRLILEEDELTVKTAELTEHNDHLVIRNDELDAKLAELNKKLDLYEEQEAWFKNKLYGRGTEQAHRRREAADPAVR